jgi:hypothetical protein
MMSVVKAYDNEGVTISTVSASAQILRGRAEIMQQEARNIFISLFGGGNNGGGSGEAVDTASGRNGNNNRRTNR